MLEKSMSVAVLLTFAFVAGCGDPVKTELDQYMNGVWWDVVQPGNEIGKRHTALITRLKEKKGTFEDYTKFMKDDMLVHLKQLIDRLDAYRPKTKEVRELNSDLQKALEEAHAAQQARLDALIATREEPKDIVEACDKADQHYMQAKERAVALAKQHGIPFRRTP